MRSPTKSLALQIKKFCNPVWSLSVCGERNIFRVLPTSVSRLSRETDELKPKGDPARLA